MDESVKKAIFRAVETEPLAKLLKMRLIDLKRGQSIVAMTFDPDRMNNIYGRAHGGAIYALIDEAFETASQTHGTIAVALNVNVTYLATPENGDQLQAEAHEFNRTRKTAGYDIRVSDSNGNLIATCQALAYRTGKSIPFL